MGKHLTKLPLYLGMVMLVISLLTVAIAWGTRATSTQSQINAAGR